MATPRILTDVPATRLHLVLALIEEDGGTAVHERQVDGRFTVTATLPGDPAPMVEPAPGSVEFEWMTVARAEIGPKDAAAVLDHPRIVDYQSTICRVDPPDAVHWGAAFVNFCMTQAGVAGTDSARARSWLNWGREAEFLVPGCIVVLARGSPPRGHVGFYVGRDGELRIQVLGGNQHGAVGVASFDAAAVLARRLPARSAAARPATMRDMQRWQVALSAAEGAEPSAADAGRNGAVPDVASSRALAEQDLPRVHALRERFIEAGTRFAIPPALLAAIASRASRCGAALSADGLGVVGRRFGIMQIDGHSYPIRGASPDGVEHLKQAAEILASLRIQRATRHPDWQDARILCAAVSDSLRGVVQIFGSDEPGAPAICANCVADVLARARSFDALMAFDPT